MKSTARKRIRLGSFQAHEIRFRIDRGRPTVKLAELSYLVENTSFLCTNFKIKLNDTTHHRLFRKKNFKFATMCAECV